MAKKRDLTAQLDELRKKVVQESANTVARIARIETKLSEQIGELKQAVTDQADQLNRAVTAMIDLVADYETKTESTLQNHEERLKRLERRPPAA